MGILQLLPSTLNETDIQMYWIEGIKVEILVSKRINFLASDGIRIVEMNLLVWKRI